MTCRLCKGSGIVYGSPLSGIVCPACGGAGIARTGTGMACAAVSTPAEKTLLDEFAMAAMAAMIGKAPHGECEYFEEDRLNSPYNMTAGGAYCYAAAMMRERNRRDEMGNVKEATE